MSLGHNPNTVTAANSILMFKVPGYLDTAVKVQGYQANNMFSFSDANMGETVMGADGKQSGGYTPHDVPFVIALQANSESRPVFEAFRAHMNNQKETFLCQFDLTLPSTKKNMSFSGFMVAASGGTTAAQLLEGSQYTFNVVINSEDEI